MDKKARSGKKSFFVFSEKDTVFSICIKVLIIGYGVLFLSKLVEAHLINQLGDFEHIEVIRICNFLFHCGFILPLMYWLLGFKEAVRKLRNSGWR